MARCLRVGTMRTMPSMRSCSPSLLLLLFVLQGAGAAIAQAPWPVGVRDVAFANATGQGSSTLAARVLYPATTAGNNAPLVPQPGGWPVIVFLHGFALLGNSYQSLGSDWAANGFVVVLGNTAQFDNVGQEADGRATFAALVAANAEPNGFFAGAFDLQRTALAGHSMGGGNVANVLAQNPGYRCGVALAPVPPRGSNGSLVAVPLAIVAGDGDTITPPGSNAVPYYQSLPQDLPLRVLYRLDGSASHTNLAGLFVFGGSSAAVFERSAAVALACVRFGLDLSPFALEQVVGPAALAEPRLVVCERGFGSPQPWLETAVRPGVTVRASVGSEPGLAALAIAPGPRIAPLSTPFGALRIDPAAALILGFGAVGSERRLDVLVAPPNDPALVGGLWSLQALGPTAIAPLAFGGAIEIRVAP